MPEPTTAALQEATARIFADQPSESAVEQQQDKAAAAAPTETAATEPDEAEDATEGHDATETTAEDSDASAGQDTDEPADPSEAEETEDDLEPLKEALKQHGAPSLEDVPPEARPLVEKKLKDMNAAFTRAQQEQTAFRKEKAAYDAKVAYETANPVDAIIERLLKNPTLLEQVNEELTKLSEPVYAEAKTMRREAAKDRALVEAEQARKQAEYRETRALHVETTAETLAAKAGIPLALVEAEIAYTITQKGDISDAELQAIIDSKAKVFKRHVGAHKREDRKSYAKAKVNDQKTAGLKVRPSAPSATPSATGQPKAKNLQSRFEQLVGEMDFDAA